MKRHVFVSLGLLVIPAALLAGCGDGDSGPASPPTFTADGPLPTVAPSRATPTNAPLPTPAAAKDTDPIISIGSRTKSVTLTGAEFRALPTVEIEAAGEKRRGVSLTALGITVDARAGAIVTIEGRPPDLTRSGLWRGSLVAFGANAVLSIDDRGVITLAGSSIPKEQWLAAITGVGFD